MEQKRNHSSWELPAMPKGRARGCCSHRRAHLESVPSIPTLGSTRSGSLCGLCLRHQGWQEEGTAGETELREINPISSLTSTGTKRGMQRGSRSDPTRTASSTVRCVSSPQKHHLQQQLAHHPSAQVGALIFTSFPTSNSQAC